MSTGRQDRSISDQRAELTRLIEKRPDHKIVAEYADEAISGDDTERREGFLRLREDASKGLFDLVLVWDQDRLSRNDPLELGFWLKPIRDAGVRLETLASGPVDWDSFAGRVVYLIQQEAKHAFLQDLGRNTARGLLASAREGRAGTGGQSPLGYGSKDGEVWIIPEEAEIVRLIFTLYLKPAGSLRSVAAELNRRKIKTPQGGKAWRMSSVRTILKRRKYTGSFVYGERNGGKYFCFRDNEIIPRRKGDKVVASEPIIHPDRFEAIIDQKTFDRAQRKLTESQTETSPRKARRYVLAGLLRCGDCGGSMGGLSRSSGALYRCRLYHQTGRSACYCNTIGEGPLVDVVSRKIRERYLSEAALDRLRRKVEKKLAERDRPPSRRDLERLEKEIETLDRKIDQGAERVFDAPAEIVPTLYHKLEEHKTERDRLRAKLDALTSREKRPSSNIGSQVDQAIEALRGLREALERARPEDSRELLSSIVSRIELHFDHEETEGGRHRNTFSHGTIYVRPDAGSGAETDPNSTQLSNIGPMKKRPCPPSAERHDRGHSTSLGHVFQSARITQKTA